MNDFDVLIIGAGAAGLAAGHYLSSRTVSFHILEARPRIGGRAHTIQHGPLPIDMGCGWLHSADRNDWREIAETIGFDIDRNLPSWGKQAFDLGFSADDQDAFSDAADRFNASLFATAKNMESDNTIADRDAASLFEKGNRWNPLIDAISTYMSGDVLSAISILDLSRYDDTEINWRVTQGYGNAIAHYGKDLPVTLECAVSEIDHSGTRLKLTTTQGTFTARALIFTVPPTLLASGAIRFKPELPAKLEAAHGLPLGIANKLLLGFDATSDLAKDLPVDGHLFGRTDRVDTASFHLRPYGRPLIEGYFGGALAQHLEKQGAAAFEAFAKEELTGLFGAAFCDKLHLVTATGWAFDPFSLGSYSYARPGHANARAALAETVDDRLFFAGEACSKHSFSTAHGAYQTGMHAAQQALAAILPESQVKIL